MPLFSAGISFWPFTRRFCQVRHCHMSDTCQHGTEVQMVGTQALLTQGNWSALHRGRDSPVMSLILLEEYSLGLVIRNSTARSGTLTCGSEAWGLVSEVPRMMSYVGTCRHMSAHFSTCRHVHMCWHILDCRSCPNDWYHRCWGWCHMLAHVGTYHHISACPHVLTHASMEVRSKWLVSEVPRMMLHVGTCWHMSAHVGTYQHMSACPHVLTHTGMQIMSKWLVS